MHCIRSLELLAHWHSVEALLLPIICHYLVGDAFTRLSRGVPSPFHLIDRISSPYLLGIKLGDKLTRIVVARFQRLGPTD